MNLIHEGCGGKFKWNANPEGPLDLICDKCKLYSDRGTEFFGLCGCGHCMELERLAVELLMAAEQSRLDEWLSLCCLSNLAREFIAHFFTKMGLLEHGVSVRQSWLTEKGTALLESYREHPINRKEAP